MSPLSTVGDFVLTRIGGTRITTFTMMVLDIVAARKMKSRRVSTVVSQSFMSKSVDTEYEPIWSGQMGRPTGFSPPVHEENPRFEPMRGEGPSY